MACSASESASARRNVGYLTDVPFLCIASVRSPSRPRLASIGSTPRRRTSGKESPPSCLTRRAGMGSTEWRSRKRSMGSPLGTSGCSLATHDVHRRAGADFFSARFSCVQSTDPVGSGAHERLGQGSRPCFCRGSVDTAPTPHDPSVHLRFLRLSFPVAVVMFSHPLSSVIGIPFSFVHHVHVPRFPPPLSAPALLALQTISRPSLAQNISCLISSCPPCDQHDISPPQVVFCLLINYFKAPPPPAARPFHALTQSTAYRPTLSAPSDPTLTSLHPIRRIPPLRPRIVVRPPLFRGS